MADGTKNNEGPACACGKADLYEEWLKQNEKKEETTTPTNHVDVKRSSASAAVNGDTKPVNTKE